MKSTNNTTVLKRAGIIFTIIFMLASTAFAKQSSNNGSVKLNELAVKNLIKGVSHENDGVRKASIYYVGFFRVDRAVDALVDQLEKEQYPAYRQMIVLSLYMIGNNKALEAIYKTADTDPDQEVKQTCIGIISTIDNNKTFYTAMNENK